MTKKTKRVTSSLPIALVDDLDFIADAFRVTRSALITQFLTEGAAELRRITEQHVLPLVDGGGDKKETVRAIGETLDRLSSEIDVLRKASDGIRH